MSFENPKGGLNVVRRGDDHIDAPLLPQATPITFDPFVPQPGLRNHDGKLVYDISLYRGSSIPASLEYWTAAKSWKGSFDDILISEDYRRFTTTQTIYSCDDDVERGNLEVPLQKAFTGPSFVLPANVANVHLSDLGVQGILYWMNEILGIHRKLTPEMEELLQFSLDTFTDFGQIYALLRPRWHMDPTEALNNVRERRKEDEERRSRALEDDLVVNPHCGPRRLWDLWSNRIVPTWVVTVGNENPKLRWMTVSHSWMEENRRRGVSSAINGYEWPIPIPIDTTLERIRTELLNIAALMPAEERERRGGYGGYPQPGRNANLVWLDLVCLRQEGVPSKEDTRKAEWKLDVPTIGPIYLHSKWTIYYFNGVGRPFVISPEDKNDPRHWMNRAWTLQETRESIIIAGRSPFSPPIPPICNLRQFEDRFHWNGCLNDADDVMKTLMTAFVFHRHGIHVNMFSPSSEVFEALSLMRHRSATSELDKIAGLIFFLNKFSPPLPAYIAGENTDDAWDRLIEATDEEQRAHLFFCYPEPGNGNYVWYPTWQQIKDIDTLPLLGQRPAGAIRFNDAHGDKYSVCCHYLKRCVVKGLSKACIDSGASYRKGTAVVGGHKLKIEANHNIPIPNGIYALAGHPIKDGSWGLTFWAVVRRTKQGLLEKVSSIQIIDEDSNRKMWSIMCGLEESELLLL